MIGLMNGISVCGIPGRVLPTAVAFALLHVPLGAMAKSGSDVASLFLCGVLVALFLALSLHAMFSTMRGCQRGCLVTLLGLYGCAHLALLRQFLTSAD